MGFGLHFLSLVVVFLLPLVFATTYTVAVKKGHVNVLFVYISDTGTNPPRNVPFRIGISITMVFVGAFAYVRFMQVREYLRTKPDEGMSLPETLNEVGFFFGVLAAFGITVVESFQETSVLNVHMLGAFMAFCGGSVFLIIQGFLTKIMTPQSGSNRLAYFRIFVGVSCLVLYFTCILVGIESFKYFTGDDPLRWKANEGRWELRILSTVSEWVMTALFDLYFLTFVSEFRRISMVAPQVKFNYSV